MTATPNAISDVGTLIKIPNKVSEVLIEKLNLCIGSAIHDAKLEGEETVVINIGIGSLAISLADMQCKFLPSKDLKQTIRTAVVDGVDPLELELEQSISDKLVTICSEVI